MNETEQKMIERPSDEMMGKVLAVKEGWESAHFFRSTPDTDYVDLIIDHFTDGNGRRHHDPRDCTNTALELLHYLGLRSMTIDGLSAYGGNQWKLEGEIGCDPSGPRLNVSDTRLPVSGPGFRYAIVALAIKVLEIDQESPS